MDWLSRAAASLSEGALFGRVGEWGLTMAGHVMARVAGKPVEASACGFGCQGTTDCKPEGFDASSTCTWQNFDCSFYDCNCTIRCGPGGCCATACFNYDTGSCFCC